MKIPVGCWIAVVLFGLLAYGSDDGLVGYVVGLIVGAACILLAGPDTSALRQMEKAFPKSVREITEKEG